MVEEKRILKYFLGWLIVGFIICFVGISKTYALDYNNIGYIDNYTDVLIDVTYETENNSLLTVEKTQEVYTEIKTLFINVSNYNFNANTHYQLELSLPNMTLNNANYYEVYDSNNNNCTISNEFSTFNTAYPKWDFECKNNTNAITIKVGNRNNTAITNTGTFRWNYTYLRYTNTPIENTNQQIADNIINNQNQNTEDIINNNNQNTQDIIDSNKETQDVIKDQFNSCHNSYNLFPYSNITITEAYKEFGLNTTLEAGKTYTISWESANLVPVNNYNGSAFALMPDLNNFKIINTLKVNYYTFNVTNNSTSIRIYKGTSYADGANFESLTLNNVMLNEGSYIKYEPYGEEICSNKIDDTNDKLDNLQGALTDSSTPNLDSLENSIGWLPPGPVDSILNLPLTMLNSLTNSLTKTCTPLNLTLPYVNKNIQIPCLSAIFAQITGVNGLWTWVGTISSVLILYNYLLNLYAWVDKVLTLRAEFDEAMGADLANWGRL